MKQTIFQLYCAAASLLSVIATVVLGGTTANAVLDRLSYESSLQSWELQRYSNNDAYFGWATSDRNALDLRLRPGSPRPQEEVLTALRESSAREYHEYRKSTLARSIREQAIYALFAVLAFAFHFWLLRRESSSQSRR